MQLVRYRKIVFRNNAFEAEFKVDGKSVYCNFHVNVGEKEPQLDETDLDYLEMWAYSKPVTETDVMTDKVTLTRQRLWKFTRVCACCGTVTLPGTTAVNGLPMFNINTY